MKGSAGAQLMVSSHARHLVRLFAGRQGRPLHEVWVSLELSMSSQSVYLASVASTAKSPSELTTYVGTATASSFSKSARLLIPALNLSSRLHPSMTG